MPQVALWLHRQHAGREIGETKATPAEHLAAFDEVVRPRRCPCGVGCSSSQRRRWGGIQLGDPDILVVCDAGYDVTRLAWVLRDLPVEVAGRIRADRVPQLPAPPYEYNPCGGRPPSMAASST
nr:transposase [Krasilnikovia cinnamomea]